MSTIFQMAIYGMTVALLVLLAYDAKKGRTRALTSYFGPALKAALPISILAIVAAILTGIGFMALIIPGIWVYAVFSVMAPAVVIDKAGFNALSRSASLTKGYRWPIVGTLILIGICTIALSIAATFLFGMIASVIGASSGGIIVTLILLALLYAAIYGLSGISIALIYARLREIKEGVSVDDLASVFD